jgi:hypothetical protein
MDERLVFRAAARASQQSYFLGSALATYATAEGLDDPQLAKRLGCKPGDLPRIRLCRRPDGDTSRFTSDILRIAERFGLDTATLAEILRQVEALDALRHVDSAARSFLAAARDRDEADSPT